MRPWRTWCIKKTQPGSFISYFTILSLAFVSPLSYCEISIELKLHITLVTDTSLHTQARRHARTHTHTRYNLRTWKSNMEPICCDSESRLEQQRSKRPCYFVLVGTEEQLVAGSASLRNASCSDLNEYKIVAEEEECLCLSVYLSTCLSIYLSPASTFPSHSPSLSLSLYMGNFKPLYKMSRVNVGSILHCNIERSHRLWPYCEWMSTCEVLC